MPAKKAYPIHFGMRRREKIMSSTIIYKPGDKFRVKIGEGIYVLTVVAHQTVPIVGEKEPFILYASAEGPKFTDSQIKEKIMSSKIIYRKGDKVVVRLDTLVVLTVLDHTLIDIEGQDEPIVQYRSYEGPSFTDEQIED